MENNKYYSIELFHWVGMPNDNLDMVKEILQDNPSYINETNKFGDNCLFIAVKVGNFNIVKFLVEEKNINLNHQNDEGNILMVAIDKNKKEIFNYLIEKNIDLTAKNSKGETIYHVAAKVGDSDYIEKLVELNTEAITEVDKLNRHCLYVFFENYFSHRDSYSFELLQNFFKKKIYL